MVAVRASTANTITLIMAFITIGLNYGALYHCYGLDLDAFPNGLAALYICELGFGWIYGEIIQAAETGCCGLFYLFCY